MKILEHSLYVRCNLINTTVTNSKGLKVQIWLKT